MSRPPKYTDDDIAEAIDSLIGEGKAVNPSRVRHLLGGGNIERIKAVIDRKGGNPSGAETGMPKLPPSMMAELGRHSDRSADDLGRLAARLWQSAREEASKGLQKECAALRSRVRDLEEELSEASRQLQRTAPEPVGEGGTVTNENSELVEQSERLKEALRNAESDVRASGKTIAVLERTQRQDREEIRSLHARIEELVAEIATIRAKG